MSQKNIIILVIALLLIVGFGRTIITKYAIWTYLPKVQWPWEEKVPVIPPWLPPDRKPIFPRPLFPKETEKALLTSNQVLL